jgi:hypothetical protein
LDIEIPPSAIGFTFYLDVEEKAARVTFLAGEDTTSSRVHDLWKHWPPLVTAPEVDNLGDGVFDVRLSIADQENWTGFLGVLGWRLGHLFG